METSARASGTCGNAGPGFDAMSLALGPFGDEVVLRDAGEDAVHVTTDPHPQDGAWDADAIPATWDGNAVGAVIDHLRKVTGETRPLDVTVVKGVPPGSGLGSSASSSAAAALAFAAAFGPVRRDDLLAAAVAGEARVAGAHRDDVAAALFGGLALVHPTRWEVTSVAPPATLRFAVVRPHVDLETRRMREVLPDAAPMADVTWNLAATARLVDAFHRGDVHAVGDAFSDRVATPHRAPLVPGFDALRAAAREAGALGFGFSGSGPSMVAVVEGDPTAVVAALRDAAADASVPASAFPAHPQEVRDVASYVR